MVSKENIIKEIHRLADGDDPPTHSEFSQEADHSATTARRKFGSWNEAVEAAGYESVPEHAVINKSDLIAEIQRLADGDDPPSKSDFNEGKYSSGTIHRRFGSWNRGVELAGYEPFENGFRTKSELIDEIQRLGDGNEPPTASEFRDESHLTVTSVQRRFNTWNRALIEAGFEPRGISKEDILDEIERLATDDIPPTIAEFNKSAECSSATVFNKFDSWRTAVREAGYQPFGIVAEDKLIADIQQFADGNVPPTKREFNRKSDHYAPVVAAHFGSWNEGVVAAGFEPRLPPDLIGYQPRTEYSDEFLLNDVRYELEDGEPAPNYDGDAGLVALYNRFDSLWSATVRAGLTPSYPRPLTPRNWEKLFITATEHQRPEYQLSVLLLLLTGMTHEYVNRLNQDWVTNLGEEAVIEIPESETWSDRVWTIRVPSSVSMMNGSEKDIDMLGLLNWYFDNKATDGFEVNPEYALAGVASLADLSDREYMDHSGRREIVPVVRSGDLRFSSGVRMACNGASRRQIRRHLGIDHTGWRATVDQILLWCHIHIYGFDHPESDVGGIYLDPNHGDVRKIESDGD